VRWTSIPRFYRRRLKVTLVPELLALLGIAVGVALLFASQVAGSTLSGSAARLANDVLGSVRLELLSRSPEGLQQSTLSRVRTLPGVRYATAVLEEPANAIGPRASHSIELVGVEPAATKLGGSAVRQFSSAQLARIEALAVPESIASAIGAGQLQPITLQIAGARERALVGLEVQPKQSALIASSPLVVAPLSYAQQLIGIGHRVSRIFVAPQPGDEPEVRRGLTRLAGARLDVRPAAFDATLFNQAATPIDQSTTLFSAISALVGLAFAVYAMLLTVPHRRATVYDLRMLGYTRGQVVEILLLDALVLGALASLLGLIFGELISVLLLHANPGYLVFAFPVASQRHVSTSDIGLAVGAAMLASFGGVFAPIKRIFGPFQHRDSENEEIALHRGGAALAGLLCVALTTAVLVFAPQLALLGMASLTLAVLLMLPLLLDVTLSACARMRKRTLATAPRIAIIDLQYPSNRVRSLAIAATGAIAVFGSVAIGGSRGNLQQGLNNSSRAFDSYGEIWVTPAGGYDIFDTTPISRTEAASTMRRLQGLPGVKSVGVYRGSYLDIGARRTWVLAPPASTAIPVSATQLVEGSLATATRRFREGGWVVVSQAIAAEHHLRIGSRFALPTPVPSSLRVAAIGTNLGWPPGALILNANDYARAWGSSAPSAYLIDVAPHASPARVQAQVTAALGPSSGLAVQNTQERIERGHAASHAGLAQLTQISDMVLLAAVLAMAAAMTTLIWQRRPRLAQQQVEGFYRSTLWAALLIETSLLLGTGCLTGALFGIYGQVLLSHALATVTGFPVVYSTGALVALVSFTAVTAAAVLVVALPGYAAARVRPSTLFAD
jgi:putative ABC transport system permease protein